MNARGINFLEDWIAKNVSDMRPDLVNAGKLAAKLLADGAAAGFTLADMELDEESAEAFIREVIIHGGEPGTPGD